MAEKQEIILEVNVSSMAQSMADARTQIEGMKRDYEKLIETTGAFEKESILAASAIDAKVKSYKQEEGALLRLKQAQQALEAEGVKNIKTYNANTHTLEQNTRVVNAMAAQYRNLSGTEAKKLAEEINRVNKVVIEQEAAIGRNYKQVGSYKDQIKQAVHELQGFSGASKVIGDMGLAFSSAGSGVKGFGAALATTGLPLIISGVNILIDAFKEFEPIVEGVENAFGGLSAMFSTSYEKGVALVKLRRELEKADRDALITNAEYRSQISDLEAAANNKTLDPKIRAEKLIAANKIRDEQLKYERDLNANHIKEVEAQAEQEIAAAKKKASVLSSLAQTPLSFLAPKTDEEYKAKKETLNKLAELRAKDIDLQTAQREQQIENQNKVDLFTERSLAKAVDVSKKKRELPVAELKSLEETLQKEKDARDKAFDAEANSELDAEVRQAQITARRVGSVDALVDAEIIARNRKLQSVKKGSIEEQNIIRESEDAINKIRANGAVKELDIERNKEAQKSQIRDAGFSAVKTVLSDIAGLIKAYSENEISDAKEESDANKKLLDEELSHGKISKAKHAKEIARIDDAYRKKEAEEKRKQWEIAKGIQIANAIISTAQAVIAAYSSGAAVPIAGIALGPVMAGIAAAMGAVQLGIIAATPPPKFAKGVIGLQGEGTETSDDIPAYLSKGESVLTAKATKRFHKELAQMEMAVGNRPNYQFGNGNFANGFMPIVSSDGGFVARDITRQSMGMDSAAIISAIEKIQSPKLSIVELETKQANRNRSVRISEA